MEDKIRGMIAFLAVGDALGVPHEFVYQRDIKYTGKVEHASFLWNRFKKEKKNLVIGQFSDDTEMTITLARNLIRNKGDYKRDSVIMDYIEWDNSGTPMRGKNTRALFDNIKSLKGYESRYKKIFTDTDPSTWTCSNGCLMRCSPLAIIKKFEPVMDDCSITNPHWVTKDCCQIQVAAIKASLLNKSKQDIIKLVQKIAQTKETKGILVDVAEGKMDRDLSVSKGWILHGLYCSLTCLISFDNPREAIDWVIGKHPVSDTDTNACISGALLGAFYGYNKLMEDPIIKKNWEIVRDADPSKGDVPRPIKYQLKDFDSLCKDLAEVASC